MCRPTKGVNRGRNSPISLAPTARDEESITTSPQRPRPDRKRRSPEGAAGQETTGGERERDREREREKERAPSENLLYGLRRLVKSRANQPWSRRDGRAQGRCGRRKKVRGSQRGLDCSFMLEGSRAPENGRLLQTTGKYIIFECEL